MCERLFLLKAACLRRKCVDCPLVAYNCSSAPIEVLRKEARKHYMDIKHDVAFNSYDIIMKSRFGVNYADNFMPTKANMC